MKHDGQPWQRRLAVLEAQEASRSERQNVAIQTANFQAVKAALPATAMDPEEASTIPPDICGCHAGLTPTPKSHHIRCVAWDTIAPMWPFIVFHVSPGVP